MVLQAKALACQKDMEFIFMDLVFGDVARQELRANKPLTSKFNHPLLHRWATIPKLFRPEMCKTHVKSHWCEEPLEISRTTR